MLNVGDKSYFPNLTFHTDQTLTKLRFTRNELTEDDKDAFKVTSSAPFLFPWFV
jgi:hypothetical protein